MKFIKKYYYAVLILILIILPISMFFKNKDINIIRISNENDNLHNYEINIDYPKITYNKLNNLIKEKIDTYINTFKNDIKNIYVQQDQYYTLNITYDSYIYKQYISYVFYIEYYTGGAHPNHEIWTIIYDTNLNQVITIDDLIKKDKNILNILSNISRNELIKNKNIVDINMLMTGTKPINENFSRFVFSDKGLIIFFERYQVAPYSSGNFNVIVPYNKIH